jgi:hypothetical protein
MRIHWVAKSIGIMMSIIFIMSSLGECADSAPKTNAKPLVEPITISVGLTLIAFGWCAGVLIAGARAIAVSNADGTWAFDPATITPQDWIAFSEGGEAPDMKGGWYTYLAHSKAPAEGGLGSKITSEAISQYVFFTYSCSPTFDPQTVAARRGAFIYGFAWGRGGKQEQIYKKWHARSTSDQMNGYQTVDVTIPFTVNAVDLDATTSGFMKSSATLRYWAVRDSSDSFDPPSGTDPDTLFHGVAQITYNGSVAFEGDFNGSLFTSSSSGTIHLIAPLEYEFHETITIPAEWDSFYVCTDADCRSETGELGCGDGPLAIFQDTLTLVDRDQTQAYVPFAICIPDECAPPTLYSYNIKNVGVWGRIPVINQSGSVMINGGECKDVYGVIDAGLALACDYDTLTIIVWTPEPVVYDTCVQVIHIIEPRPVPLFTVRVVTILVLALILAAAVFMRRRAVSRA